MTKQKDINLKSIHLAVLSPINHHSDNNDDHDSNLLHSSTSRIDSNSNKPVNADRINSTNSDTFPKPNFFHKNGFLKESQNII